MKKIRIDEDELYPFYTINEDGRYKTEISEEVYRFIKLTEDRLWLVNKYLSCIVYDETEEAMKYEKAILELTKAGDVE